MLKIRVNDLLKIITGIITILVLAMIGFTLSAVFFYLNPKRIYYNPVDFYLGKVFLFTFIGYTIYLIMFYLIFSKMHLSLKSHAIICGIIFLSSVMYIINLFSFTIFDKYIETYFLYFLMLFIGCILPFIQRAVYTRIRGFYS